MLNCNANDIEFSGAPAEIINDIAYAIVGLSIAGVEEIGGTVSFDEVFNRIFAELLSRVNEVRKSYLALSDDERAAIIFEH